MKSLLLFTSHSLLPTLQFKGPCKRHYSHQEKSLKPKHQLLVCRCRCSQLGFELKSFVLVKYKQYIYLCFKFRQIFCQIDIVRRSISANRSKYSSVFFRCICGYFPVALWVLTNFSNKLTWIFHEKEVLSGFDHRTLCIRHAPPPLSTWPVAT